MAEHDDERRAELLGRELHAADLRCGHNIAGDTNDEQVAETLVENHLDRYTGIRTGEYDGERRLARLELGEMCVNIGLVPVRGTGNEASIAFAQTLQCIRRRNHGFRLPPMKKNWCTGRELTLFPREFHVTVSCRQRGEIS